MDMRLPGTSPSCRPNVDSSPENRFDDRDIVAIDRAGMLVIDNRGDRYPITLRFDRFGDETEDWAETETCIAGPDPDEHSWHIAMCDFGAAVN